jgi:hypothetical protein
MSGDHPEFSMSDFERSLLEAGRHDSSAPDGVEKWGEFAARMTMVSGSIAPLSGVHLIAPEKTAADLFRSASGGVSLSGKAAMGSAALGSGTKALLAQWLLLGSMGAFGAVVGALGSGAFSRTDEAPQPRMSTTGGSRDADQKQTEGQVASLKSVPVATEVILKPADTRGDEPFVARGGLPKGGMAKAAATSVPSVPRTVVSEPPRGKGSSEAAASGVAVRAVSTLGDEAEQLDQARRAGGARALYLVRQFHRDYPRSALAADAEFVALRALYDLHEEEMLRERALAFVARFPGDPHEGSVLVWLRERSGAP